MAGRADFFKSGSWNATCDLCGAKEKADRMELTWNGLYTCKHHKERRNPQDFLRGVKDNQTVPWSRPWQPPLCDTTSFPYTEYCTLQGKNAIPGFAIPGCAEPAYINTAFYPSIVQWRGWAIQDTYGCPILDTNGQMIFPPDTPSATNPPGPYGLLGSRLDIDFYLDVSILL